MGRVKKLGLVLALALSLTACANKDKASNEQKQEYNALIVREDENGNIKYIYDTGDMQDREPQDISLDAILKKCEDDYTSFVVETVTSSNPNDIGGPCKNDSLPHILRARDKTGNCSDGLIREVYCRECERTFGSKRVSSLPHYWGDWYFLGNSNCKNGGTRERKCEVCGEKQTETAKSFEHEYGGYRVETSERCTKGTRLVRHCKFCDEIEEKVYEQPGHKDTYWEIFIEPTPVSAGAGLRKCRDCGEVLEQSLIMYEDLSKYLNNEIPYIPETPEDLGIITGQGELYENVPEQFDEYNDIPQ